MPRKPWWEIWDEVKDKPISPELKPIAEYYAAGLKWMCSIKPLKLLKKSDDAP